MASLNTLRTKFGYVLSAVIAFALLAFIFSLKSEMGFSGSDPVVGIIDSEDVLYSEYYAEYQDVKAQSGMTESTEQAAASLANAAWQSMFSKRVITPGLEMLGISMSEAERMAVINGNVPTQTFASAFTNPTTGVYDSSAIAEFLLQASQNPEAEAAWSAVNEQARQERTTAKFGALVRSGVYVNKLEVAEGVNSANKTFAGKWVSVPFSSVADSLFTVSNSEIKNYYQSHKAMYRKQPSRSIGYVTFAFEPTADDIINIENQALEASKEFEAAEDLRAYVRGNLNGAISTNYMSTKQLSDDERAALTVGAMYGPVNNNNVWTMSRVVSSIVAPDTIGARHIVLRYDQAALADSLHTALKGGADFAEAARSHSLYAQTAQAGGEVGVMPFSTFSGEFANSLKDAKKGDIVKVVDGDMIQLIEVYRADRPSRHYQVATVEYPVEASQATIAALHSQAGLFAVEAKGTADAFKKAAEAQGVVARNASITNGERSFRLIGDSREIARWAYGAEVGELSDIFKTEDGYVVAVLSAIDDSEYRSLDEATSSIRMALLRDKKFAQVAATMTGSTIDEVAEAVGTEVKEFSNVKLSSQYVAGMGVEPRVVGAIALGNIEGLSAPIMGNNAAYVLDIEPVAVSTDQTETLERARAQATVQDRTTQYIFNAIQEMAKIKDLRGQYF